MSFGNFKFTDLKKKLIIIIKIYKRTTKIQGLIRPKSCRNEISNNLFFPKNFECKLRKQLFFSLD